MRPSATLLVVAGWFATGGAASAHDLTGFVAADYRGFWETGLFSPQRSHQPSLVLEPEYYHAWNGGDDVITVTPFFRLDGMDTRRTHFDQRELSWLHVAGDFELLVGIGKVFWGVTEVEHLVDIINQTDLIEDIDFEEKLGQPMVRLSWIQDWGTLTLFSLPGFRERTFPGKHGRFRAFRPVDVDDAQYQSGAEWRHVDWALRYSHTLGDWDVGVAHFWGTSREPRFVARVNARGIDLLPYYDIIHQSSVDVQATIENWLLKFEGIHRTGQGHNFFATTGGIEYSFYGILGTNIDLGVVLEGMYDNRDPKRAPINFYQQDVFGGIRLGFNDVQTTELLGGAVYDIEYGYWFYFLEASRRIGDRWKVELDVRIFSHIEASDPDGFIRRDDHVQLRIARFF